MALVKDDFLLSYALTEGSGVAVDASSNGNDTLSAPTWVTGDATYDPYVHLANAMVRHAPTGVVPALHQTQTHVFTFRWPTSVSKGTYPIWGLLAVPGPSGYDQAQVQLSTGGTEGNVQWGWRDSTATKFSGLMSVNQPMRDDAWHTVSIELNPDAATPTAVIYYDGVLQAITYTDQNQLSTLSYTGEIGLGGRVQAGAAVNGKFHLGYYHIIDRSLTASERASDPRTWPELATAAPQARSVFGTDSVIGTRNVFGTDGALL